MESLDNDIMGTGFYTYHDGENIYLGVGLPVGVFYEIFNRIDWLEWLRREIYSSQHSEIPHAFEEAFK